MRVRAHTLGLVLAVGGILSTAWVLSRAQKVNTPPKYLLTDKSVVILSAPQVVAGPVVVEAKWSPDGVHVAAMRRTERSVLENVIPEMRLVIWSAGKQSHEIWQSDMALSATPQIAWLSPEIVTVELKWREIVQGTNPNGQNTVAAVDHQSVLWVDVARNQVKTVPEVQGDHLYVSPTRPFAALLSPGQHLLTLMNLAGNAVKKIPLPEKTTWQHYQDDTWSADGLRVKLNAMEPINDKPDIVVRNYDLLVQTGELKPDGFASPMPNPPAGPLRLTRSDQEVTFGRRKQHIRPLWLESTHGGEQPEVMLASDSTGGKISPTGQSVLFYSEQSVFVTALQIGPKEPFLTALRTRLMSNGKQLALGIIMYTQDYDETFPIADSNIQSALNPYLKNDDLYEGFNYLGPGGTLGDISKPAETQIGTVDGPGGQVIIFVDGHVRWFPR